MSMMVKEILNLGCRQLEESGIADAALDCLHHILLHKQSGFHAELHRFHHLALGDDPGGALRSPRNSAQSGVGIYQCGFQSVCPLLGLHLFLDHNEQSRLADPRHLQKK